MEKEELVERKLPKVLYRYRAMDKPHDMNAIKHQYLWLSERSALNDPFEMEAIPQVIMPCPIKNPEEVEHLLRLQGASESEIREYMLDPNIRFSLNQQKKRWQKGSRELYEDLTIRTRVCCFAEECDNILMWSHYGRALKGVVFGFDVVELADTDKPDDFFYPVSYPADNSVPEVDTLKIYSSKNDNPSKASVYACKQMFATKSTH